MKELKQVRKINKVLVKKLIEKGYSDDKNTIFKSSGNYVSYSIHFNKEADNAGYKVFITKYTAEEFKRFYDSEKVNEANFNFKDFTDNKSGEFLEDTYYQSIAKYLNDTFKNILGEVA